MARAFNPTTTAFSVERMRAIMLKDVQLPEGFLQGAVDTTFAKLKARKTLFFAHQGEIVDQAEVDDHATQLAAADKILSMAGVYARERDATPQAPTVTLEMDPETGIVRLIVGPTSSSERLDAAPEALALTEANDFISVPQVQETSVNASAEVQVGGPPEPVVNDDPVVVKVRRGGLPAKVHQALFGDA